MSASVLYMSMSVDGYIAGPGDDPGNPGGDGFMRLHEWYGYGADGTLNTKPGAAEGVSSAEDPGRRGAVRRRPADRGAGRPLGR